MGSSTILVVGSETTRLGRESGAPGRGGPVAFKFEIGTHELPDLPLVVSGYRRPERSRAMPASIIAGNALARLYERPLQEGPVIRLDPDRVRAMPGADLAPSRRVTPGRG